MDEIILRTLKFHHHQYFYKIRRVCDQFRYEARLHDMTHMRNPNRQAAKRRASQSEGSDTILIYNSSNGATEKYAEWIAEALDCDVMKYSRAKLGYASMYKNIIFGSWIRGGEITRFNMLRANLSNFGIDNNNLIVFATGVIEPTDEYRTFVKGLNGCKQLPDDCFYMLPGKYNSKDCKSADKITLKAMGEKIFVPVHDDQVQDAKERFEYGYDGIDHEAILPILEKVREFRGA